ncbi:polyhydroxyalkanoate synthase [Sphingobium boeckii]|uniref:Polyhydroxyalkanoate synthase n=2 Tax=Sphingobium boeckii TaxID=1082345 RepID=A0A7W9AH28_9SPHN|nr:polyhydroxyalkanoate synthase [Sphingobium boeckii]
MPIVATAGRAMLRDYGGSGLPVIFIPSLINPPFILDLTAQNSLLRWLARKGVRPLLVDWGAPEPADRDQDIAAHVEHLLLPLIDALGERPALAGYCLGGTMALAAAQLRDVAGLALIATPWQFAGFPPSARADMASLWASAAPACEPLGLMPMEMLQSGFWRLDPGRTVRKFETFAALDPAGAEAAAFIALEDWANGGAPLTLAAAREAFEDLFAANKPGLGQWRVGGALIDPSRLTCPAIDIVSLNDRIVPAASAANLPHRIDLRAGHVGMIVGRGARTALWEPLAAWLSQLQCEC